MIIAYQTVTQSSAKDMNKLINYLAFKSNFDTAIGRLFMLEGACSILQGKYSKGNILMNLGCLGDCERQLIDPKSDSRRDMNLP